MEISGIAAFPRLSENNVFYWPQELKKFDGVVVPLRWMHIQTGEAIIGEATFIYNEEQRQVLYTARVDSEEAIEKIKNGNYKVSIGAKASPGKEMCHKDGQCVEAPIINEILELSVVDEPGIPEGTLNHESKKTSLKCVDPIIITSVKPNVTEKQSMTDKALKECDCDKTEVAEAPQTAPVKTEVEAPSPPCPEGWKEVDGACVKDDTPAPEAPKDESTEVPAQTKDVTINVNTQKSESTKSVDVEKLTTEIKADILKEMGEKFTPKSEIKVSESKELDQSWKESEKEWTPEAIKEGLNHGGITLTLEKEGWVEEHKQSVLREAVSATSVSGVKLTSDIIVIPGTNTFEPLRALGQFEAIPKGQDTARFWTLDVAAFGAITESTSTDITASTHTLTPINVTTATRGILQQVLKSQFEDLPPQFLEKLKTVLRLAAIKDEHNLIVQTLASTDNDFNNGTAVLTAGWPAHISGVDGTFVDTTITEDALGEFKKEGITAAKKNLSIRGYDTVSNRIVAIISPRQYDQLILDPDISTFVQQGDPSISVTGTLSRYFGIEIMVSNELLVANNSQRGLVIVAGASFALASQREMEVEMDKEIAGQYINIVISHRIGVEELDKQSYCIVSSKND